MKTRFIPLVILATIILTYLPSCEEIQDLGPPNDSSFIKFYGGDASNEASDLLVDANEIVMLGTSNAFHSEGKREIYLIKTDEEGNIIWRETYSFGGDDSGVALAKYDGYYIVAANSIDTCSGFRDIILFFVFENTGLVASKIRIGGNNSKDDIVNAIHQKEGNLWITGSTFDKLLVKDPEPQLPEDSEILLARMSLSSFSESEGKSVCPPESSNQVKIWRYGFGGKEEGVAINSSSVKSGIISVLANTDRGRQDGFQEMLLINFTENGGIASLQALNDEEAHSEAVDLHFIESREQFLVLGNQINESLSLDRAFGLYLAPNSLEVDQESRTGIKNTSIYFQAADMHLVSDNNFLVAGTTLEGGTQNAVLLLFETRGNLIWKRTFGSIEADEAVATRILADGSPLLLGTVGFGENTRIMLVKTFFDGKLIN